MNAFFVKPSSIHNSMRKLAFIVPALFACVEAHAGTDTLVSFANLSPYQATVSFPAASQTCWHDDGAESDGRIDEYRGYYRANSVSNTTLAPYMNQFKGAYGVKDLASVPTVNMAGTQQTMNAASSKQAVSYAAFRGETSAELLGGCKNATSSRGFDVTLKDASGNVVSVKHYLLSDPPDSEWRLSRLNDTNTSVTDQTIVLGSGGEVYPLEIVDVGVTAGFTALTVLSIGSAGAELWATRAMYVTVLRQAGYSGLRLYAKTAYELGKFALVGGLRSNMYGLPTTYVAGLGRNKTASMVYMLVADGVLGVSRMLINTSGQDQQPTLVDADDSALKEMAVDMSSPQLVVNAGLPSKRSVCAYETKTLGFITECRVTGIHLSIMPDGSLDFLPLPPVGSGT